MKSYSFIILGVLSLAFSMTAQAGDRPISYAFQIFQLSGGFTQKTSLKEKIWKASDKSWDKIKGEVTVFDTGEFRNGKDKLVLRPKSCFWNDQMLTFEKGQRVKLPERKIKMISSPSLTRKEKELVSLKVTSEQPYQFMKRQKNGLFKLQEKKLPTGLDLQIKSHTVKRDVYDIDYLKIDLRAVNRREPAKGTTLPVGEPILSESEYVLKLRIREFRSYGIVLQPKGTDSLFIVRIEIDD